MAKAEDYLAASREALLEHYGNLRRFYGDTGIRASIGASVSGNMPETGGVVIVHNVGEFVGAVLAAARP